MPLENYIARFTMQYRTQRSFRASVHAHLKLSKREKFRLAIEKTLMPARYKQETDELIQDYAKEARQKAIEYSKVIEEQLATEKAQAELEITNKELEKITLETEQTKSEYSQIQAKKNQETERILAEFEMKRREEAEKRRSESERIENKTDAEKIAQQKIQEYLKRSQLLVVDEKGNSEFNNEALTRTLENRILNEVVGEIEKETGKTGFIATTKREYDGLISHYAEMDDWSEFSDVDWMESIATARTRGYRVPKRISHFIVAKYGRKRVQGKVALDSALMIDTSGSMKGAKFAAVQKVGWALSALMRKLNPENKRYMSRFSNDVSDITSLELMREVSPEGGTRTDLALAHGLELLKDSPLAMFYLLTDGYPEPESAYTESLKIAAKFQEYPNIKLRIFYVGDGSDSKRIIREIGKAAGPSTKISIVNAEKVASGVLMDFQDSIKQMARMEDF